MDDELSALIDVGALVAAPGDSDLLFDADGAFDWSACDLPQAWEPSCAFDKSSLSCGAFARTEASRKQSSSSSSSQSVISRNKHSRNSSFSVDTTLSSSYGSPVSSHAYSGLQDTGTDFCDIPELSPPSTPSISSLEAYGILIESSNPALRTWRCAYPTCSSRATFTRGSDLRKHYHRHSKHLFCRYDGCPRSEKVASAIAEHCEMSLIGGFSHQHDLERHEAQHKPNVQCEWVGRNGQRCSRMFSRTDNMKDHVKRVHGKSKRRK